LEGGGGGNSAGRGRDAAASNESTIHVDFPALSDSLISRITLASPSALLLTYSLLHTHNTFLPVLVSCGCVQKLLVALLKTLYVSINTVSTACKEYASDSRMRLRPSTIPSLESIYLVVINLLLIVQDVKLRPLLSKLTVASEDLSWYKEKTLSEISLGDLTLLCTLRAAMTSLQHLHDPYLLTNLLAIVLDLAAFVQHISPYCAERVVVLTYRLCKKYTKLMDAGGVGSSHDMGECLKVLLVLIATTVRDTGKQLANINMLYTLARKHGDISAMDAFAGRHVTALFTSELGGSTGGTLVLENDSNTGQKAVIDTPLPPAPLSSSRLPLPLSRNNSTNTVPSLARNCSSPASFDGVPKSAQPSNRQRSGDNGNVIPPNIHIIRATQRGLHLLQQQSSSERKAAGRELVDHEADIVPRSAVQALALLSQQLGQLQQSSKSRGAGLVGDSYEIVPMDFGRFVMYAYEEGPTPAEFFVPFVWEAAVSLMRELAWRRDQVTLFEGDTHAHCEF